MSSDLALSSNSIEEEYSESYNNRDENNSINYIDEDSNLLLKSSNNHSSTIITTEVFENNNIDSYENRNSIILDTNLKSITHVDDEEQLIGQQQQDNETKFEDIDVNKDDIDDENEKDMLPIDIEKRVSLYMLASHFITRMGDKMWDFIIPITLIVISPQSLIPSSLYGLSITLVGMILSPSVGRMVDIKKKLPMIRIAISSQVFSLATSAVLLYLLMRSSESNDSVKENIFSSISTAFFFIILLFSAAIHSIASKIMNISVERKWVPLLIKRDSRLTIINTRMRQIDLFSEVSAPFIAGMLTTIPNINEIRAFMIVAIFNFISFFPQFYFLQLVYRLAPTLLDKQEHEEILLVEKNTSDEQQEVENGEKEEEEVEEQQTTNTSNWTLYNPITNLVRGWKLFIRQSVFLVIIAFVFLWFTILSPHDPLLTAYLSSAGYTNLQLGVFRGVGALFGLLSTMLFEPMVRRFGLANTTTIYIAQEGLTVLLAGFVFSLLPLTTATRYIFLILIVVSRIGLYGFELGEIHFVQRGVQDSIRGNISGVETSLTSLAMLVVFIGGLAVHSTTNFSILIWASIIFINMGVITLFIWRFTKPIDMKLHKLNNH